MRTVRVIKEPIHDYIAISELENKLINDPLFLRLQHISQNGLAHLTYSLKTLKEALRLVSRTWLGIRPYRRSSDIQESWTEFFDAILE